MNVIPHQLGESLGGMLDGLRGAFDFVSGVNDVVVVRHPDGSVYCSTFCVQTNASTVNRHMLGKDVSFELNGRPTDLAMVVGDDGRCVFRYDSNEVGAVPDLEALARVPMRDGRNSMDFRIGDDIVASAGLFSWSSTDWVVVVDIDGTITQTDVGGVVTTSELGQQLLGQQLGLTHAHADVCEAMSLLACGGYRLLFVTARPITRSHATRRYLASIGRAGGTPMPDGALLTSAKGTLGTIATVWGDVKSYKLRVLQEVQSLFTPPGRPAAGGCNYAGGFGNHDYDAQAYIEAGCPPGRVFLIDEDSNVTVYGTEVVYKGYTGLIAALPDLFPPVVVVHWERAKASGSFNSGGVAGGWSPPPPLSAGGAAGSKNPLSYNKIPGVALLGEGLGKVWGGVQDTVQQMPGAKSLSKVDLYRATGFSSSAAADFGAAGTGSPGGSGGGGVGGSPGGGGGGVGGVARAAAAPPPYDSAEGQGLIDLGVDGPGQVAY